MLIDILFDEDKGNVMNKNRFVDEFTGSELIMPKKNPKPEDYELLFCGNSNDDFKIGITITKKSMKVGAHFFCGFHMMRYLVLQYVIFTALCRFLFF